MKKSLLMFAAMLMAFVASASSVKFTNPDGWTTVCAHWWDGTATATTWPGETMTQDGDVWTIEIEGTPGWIIFNNGGKGSQTGNLPFEDGATYDLNGVVGAVVPSHTLYFENTADWSEVYFYGWMPEVVGGWPGKLMTKGEDNVWSITFESYDLPSGIKIHNGAGLDTGDIDKGIADDVTFLPDGTVKGGEVVTPPVGGENPVLYITGDFCKYQFEDAYKMTETDGVYTLKMDELTGNFKISTDGWGEQWSTLNTEMELDTPYTCVDGDGLGTDMALATGTTNATITFVYATKQLTITGEGEIVPPTPVLPEKLYIVGSMTGWAANDDYLMEKNDNVYTFTFTEQLDATAEFKLFGGTWDWSFGAGETNINKNSSSIDAWYCYNGQALQPANFKLEGLELAEGQAIENLALTFTLVEGSNVNDSSVPSTLAYTFNVLTGVESVIADSDSTARYYNLQGVEVANPANGMFIKVAAGKATKVYVK